MQDATTAADSAARARTTVFPIVSYSGVTGIQYGATLFRTYRTGRDSATRASSLSLYAARTSKHYAKALAQAERWSADNGLRLRARLEHTSYPLPYYGLGASAADSAEEWYSHGVTVAYLLAQQEWRSANYAFGGLRLVQTRAMEAEPGGAIAPNSIPGSSGGTVVSAELGVVVDAREHLGAPRRGNYARLVASSAARVLGGDFSFRRLTLDARRYAPIGPRGALAVQLQYDGVAGTAPFDQLPMLGADSAMRGYPRGRYRDNHAVTVQAEVRSGYWRRTGAVAFIGAGTVAPDAGRLGRGPWFPTVGLGLRALLVPRDRTLARLDVGFGRRSVGLSVGLGEAF